MGTWRMALLADSIQKTATMPFQFENFSVRAIVREAASIQRGLGLLRAEQAPVTTATVDMDLFTCPRHVGQLRLTKTACAAMWEAGRYAPVWDATKRVCHGCEIGRAHAGLHVSCETIDTSCVCCHRANRQMVYGLVCISCYNRSLELLKGRTRRGNPPGFGSVRDATPWRVVQLRGLCVATTKPDSIRGRSVILTRAVQPVQALGEYE